MGHRRSITQAQVATRTTTSYLDSYRDRDYRCSYHGKNTRMVFSDTDAASSFNQAENGSHW